VTATDNQSVNPSQTKYLELRDQLEKLDNELLELGYKATLTEEEEERYQDLKVTREPVKAEFTKLEERLARNEEIAKSTYREIKGMPEIRKPVEEYYGRDVRKMSEREARDGALKILADREQNYTLSTHQLDHVERVARKDSDLARRILVTENEHYRSAFHKLLTRPGAMLTLEEQQAMLRHDEYRAQSEGSTTAGGFAVPVFIDPSVILTDQESDNPFLRVARQVNVTTNAWKGVSAAGVVWSFDAEASEVSDDDIDLAQPQVDVETARGFIPYSIEIGEDWPGFQAEMARLLGIGYDELLLEKFTLGAGSGSNEPRGLVTALDANTNVEVATAATNAFVVGDLYNVWAQLPQKYRRRASWMGSVGTNNLIRQFGTANNFHGSTVDLTEAMAGVLMNRPYLENDYVADFTSGTSSDDFLVVGDFENYVVARRTGMSVELVPHLFATNNNRPSGQRGWFAYARIGGNSVNDLGFRLLQTTA
jgi:HK97 family phage major capsid protein